MEEENFTPSTGTESYEIYYCMLLRNLSWNKQVLGADSVHFVKNVLTKGLNRKKKLLNPPGEFKNLLEAITKITIQTLKWTMKIKNLTQFRLISI